MKTPGKGLTQVPGELEQTRTDFTTLLRVAPDLELRIYFLNFAFDTYVPQVGYFFFSKRYFNC